MKTRTIVASMLVVGACTSAGAQTVSSRAPVVVPAQFLTVSSPVGQGQVVTAYRSPELGASVTTVPAAEGAPPAAETKPSIAAPASPATSSVPYYAPGQGAGINALPGQQPAVIQQGISSPVLPPSCSPVLPTPSVVPAAVAYPVSPVPASPAPRYALRPILPIMNLPAGTYVGQGLIGQPKAYVQGQPIRNFFRYLLP